MASRPPQPRPTSRKGGRLDWSAFDEVAEVLALQGFNVIPLPPLAKGAGGSGVLFSHLNKPDSRRVSPLDRAKWESVFRRKGFGGPGREGKVGAYLLPASNPGWAYAVVDVDDPECDARALEDFGPTPLYVTRSGRVRHRYYRTDNPRAAHLLGAYGRHTVDIIATTGVVLPGSEHEDGGTYTLSIPMSEWTEAWVKANVPTLNTAVVDRLRFERTGALQADLRATKVEGKAAGFIHLDAPVVFADSAFCGHVLPSTIIQTVNGPVPLKDVQPGTKCFATYRDDSRPSSHVSHHGGRTYFWDMSAQPKRHWVMVESMGVETDPEDDGRDLASQLEQRLGVEVIEVEDRGFLADQVGLLPDDSTTFLIAPHGSGKTVMARREHERAVSSVSVTNTQALTIANAAVLGLRAVYDGVDTSPKGSACIPSLHRYDAAPEFFHCDEADAVHGYLHAGKMRDPLLAWKTLAHFAATSTRALIASADLSFEDVALFAHAIRERNAGRKVRAIIRRPTRNRGRVVLVPSAAAKETIHQHLQAQREAPLFVGLTARKLAGHIAQGYRSAAAKETVSLEEVSASVDTPTPEAVDLGPLPGAEVESAFFVSGENNRHHEAVRWLEDTDLLVDSHDLLVTTPAVQSGVSLTRPVSKVVVLHHNRQVPADTVLQIARRCRHPQDRDIEIGVMAWSPRPVRTDRPHLDDLIHKRTEATTKAVVQSLPDLEGEVDVDVDAEFLWSWRITTRRLLRSYADPIAALKESATRHGFEVVDRMDMEPPEPGGFQEIVRAAKTWRVETNADEVVEAEPLGPTERDRLEASPKLQDGERAALDHTHLRDFYALPVDRSLVLTDAGGKFRACVRNYTHARLIHEVPEVVAYLDHTRNRDRQPSQHSHASVEALLMVDLYSFVLGVPFDGEPVEFGVHEVRDAVKTWWVRHRHACAVFFPKMTGPRPDYQARWLCARLRSLGASILTTGRNASRRKMVTWETVDHLSEGYAARLFDLFEKSKGQEQWRRQWKKDLMTKTAASG